ncbi:cation/H(+) antiporter 15-like [Papaver somniferum]|uniref:cation/H(+) antiporter 15-like n=1 Tax=Papaver somniferum TaxID=3469 RepID=UPI000E7008F8|nr:cation/H(+) antiporter 15-like [Papaver somniferum]
MAATTCELKWLKQLLGDLGVRHPHGMQLLCDSQSTLYIAQNPVFHERTKHIEVDCHVVRDAIVQKIISPSYTPTAGGILASPWVLSSRPIKVSTHRDVGINYFIFPRDGFQVVDMLAHFSSMFFIFKVGVQMDAIILKRAGRRPYIIGFCCIFCSYVAGLQISKRLQNNDIPALKLLHKSSDRVVDLFGQISFPVIAYVLDELKILNSDLGYSAIHISMVADFLHMALKFFSFFRQIMRGANHAYALPAVLILLGTVIYIFFIMRPAALWIVKNTPEGRPVDDIYITLIMISVLLCGLASEYCGLNGTVGVFLLGLAIPDGPPLGSALVKKLSIVSVFFMPLHMGIVGYKMDIHKVTFGYLWRALLIILGCILGKIIGLFIPAVLLGVSPRDSFLLGLIMNIKGVVEVSTINTWLDSINIKEIFTAPNTIMVLALVVLVAIITPAVKYLQDASLTDDLARPNISNRAIKTLLQNLLRDAPCSVGILMDGSNLQTKSSCFLPDTPYRVIVLFFGGPDDREALAFAMNMIHHPYVFVTLVRFYGPASLSSYGVIHHISESVSIDTERHKFLDDELVDHFRVNTMHDETLIYKEVEVKDGAETIWAVRSLHQDFDLMIVGRQQKADSKIISGLEANWDECGELGAIGDLVTSPDYGALGSILIIHRRREII